MVTKSKVEGLMYFTNSLSCIEIPKGYYALYSFRCLSKFFSNFIWHTDNLPCIKLYGNFFISRKPSVCHIYFKNKDGKLQYVMLEGEPGHQDAILRTEHSIKELEKQGVKTEKLATDTANWQRAQGQEKMSAWLSAYGDKVEEQYLQTMMIWH
jgi:hypothetical protein